MPEKRTRAALDQTPRRCPLPVADGAGQRRAAVDRRARALDIGSRIEQRIDQRHIVIAGPSMQWRLAVPHPDRRRIEVGAGRSEGANDVDSIRIVPRPIGEKMQRRSPATLSVVDHAMGEPRIGCEQPAQPLDLAVLKCRRELDGKRLVTSERASTRHHRPV
jgi:hypothetical protein